MRRFLPITLLAITLVAFAPSFIAEVSAIGCASTCYLQTLTNVPSSEATITIRLDNTTFYQLPHLFPFANGTRHSIEVMNVTFKGVSGSRYVWKQWEQCGLQAPSGTATMFHTPLMVANYTTPCPSQYNGPYSARFDIFPPAGCKTNCYIDVLTTVAPADGPIMVKVDNSAVYSLPQISFPFANGTIHTIQVLNGTFTATSGARYVWKQWSCACSEIAPTPSTTLTTPAFYYNYTDPARSPPLNGRGGITAVFDKEYQLTLTFSDASGQPVNPPTATTLQSGSTTVMLDSTTYSSHWMSAVVWNVVDATWEGTPHSLLTSPTIDLTAGAIVKSIPLKAYPAKIRVVDMSNNPLAGAKLTVILSNSTSNTFTTDSQGLVDLGRIPIGSYSTQISYLNQDRGKWAGDASQTPTNTIQLNVGGSTTATTVSAAVFLAIFGIAIFLVLLAIMLRKKTPPPKV